AADCAGRGLRGTRRVPALFSTAGLRSELTRQVRFEPYLLGGIGFAHMSPTAEFSYASGSLPDGSTASVGDDVTNQIVTAGDFTLPASTTSFMYTLGGGVDVPVAGKWVVDAGYRFSRINSDT